MLTKDQLVLDKWYLVGFKDSVLTARMKYIKSNRFSEIFGDFYPYFWDIIKFECCSSVCLYKGKSLWSNETTIIKEIDTPPPVFSFLLHPKAIFTYFVIGGSWLLGAADVLLLILLYVLLWDLFKATITGYTIKFLRSVKDTIKIKLKTFLKSILNDLSKEE